jgi:hypothetical protein
MTQRPLEYAGVKLVVAKVVNVEPLARSRPQIAPHLNRYGGQQQRVRSGPAIPVVHNHDIELILEPHQRLEGIVGNSSLGRRQR